MRKHFRCHRAVYVVGDFAVWGNQRYGIVAGIALRMRKPGRVRERVRLARENFGIEAYRKLQKWSVETHLIS